MATTATYIPASTVRQVCVLLVPTQHEYIFIIMTQWLDFHSVFGGEWDLYLTSFLLGCVIILLVWRTRR